MLPSYAPGEASAYATAQGWQFRRSGNELIFKECVFCTKPWKLYVNDQSGAYDCKSASCGKRGNYFTLRRDIGDPVAALSLKSPRVDKAPTVRKRHTIASFASFEWNLEHNPAAMAYLTGRGLTVESIKKWHLGLKTETNHEGKVIEWLMIPYITKQGEIADVKYRSLPPAEKWFKRLGGGESILFGEYFLPDKKTRIDTVYLCEGELDCITLDQHGFGPVFSTTTGAASFNPRWYDLIVASGAKRVVLIYDSDVDGQAGADKLAKKFTDAERDVINVVLEDCKDSNEFFLQHSAEDLQALINNSRPVEIEYVHSGAVVLDMLEEAIFNSSNAFDGQASQFRVINDLIDGGFANSTLTTVIGASGTGKTSYVLQELLGMGAKGLPTYLCCLEMPEVMIMRKVINHLFHIPLRDITLDHIRQYRPEIERRNLYFGRGIRNIRTLDETFRRAAKRYDLKCIAFDNIHYLVRDIENSTAELGLVCRTLKDLSVDLNIPIIAVAQPTKFDRAERIINENDVKGSSSIEQDSDVMLLMWRPTLRTDIKDFGKTLGQKQNMSPLTLFRAGKARYTPGGEVLLYFHGEVGKFRELEPDEQARLLTEAAEQAPEPEKRRGR